MPSVNGSNEEIWRLKVEGLEDVRQLADANERLNQTIQDQNRKLAEQSARISELTAANEGLKKSTGIGFLEDQLKGFQETSKVAVKEFESFLKSVNLLDQSKNVFNSEKFAGIAQQIQDGARTAGQAITEVKTKYAELIGGSGGALDSGAMESFRATLENVLSIVNSISDKIADIQTNGVKSIGDAATNGGGVQEALREIDIAAKNLSDDAKGSYEAITKILSAINDFSNVDSGKLYSVSQTLKSLSSLGGAGFSDAKVGNIVKLSRELKRLGEESTGQSKLDFSIKVTKTAVDNLGGVAANLKAITRINADKLEKLQGITFDNFKNLKIDNSSIKSITDFVNAINSIKTQMTVPKESEKKPVVDTKQYKEATAAVKEYYSLLQKMYATGPQGRSYRQNVEEQNGSFVAKSDDVKVYVEQLNAAKAAMESYRASLNDDNSTRKQREDLDALIASEQKHIDLLMETANRTDNERAEKERSAALKEAGELLERMIRLREEYNGKLKVTGSDAFQNNDANIAALQAMVDGVKNGTVEVDVLKGKLEELKGTTDANADSMRNLAGTTNSLASGISRYFAMMFSGYRIVMMAVREIKKMVSTSIELDSAMTQLQIVTHKSDAAMMEFGQTAAQVAKDTATSITDVLDSATVYARLGYSLEESATLSKYTGMLQRVGNIDVSNAQDAITAIIKAYNIDATQVDQVEDVMNKLVKVGNNFPISVEQIAEGMNNASAALAAAGNSFEESVALLTAANTVVQNASKASTGLRTIAARLRNTKAELDELGEEMITTPKYEELVQHLTDYNVSLLDTEGNYRSTYEIMKDLARVWDDMAPNVQAAITTALAGTRQQAIFNSIISQFKEASGAMAEMTDSAGELSSAFAIYMDSTEAHVKQFKTAFQELSKNAIDSDFVKNVVDLGTHLIKSLNTIASLIGKIGGLNTALLITAGIIATIKAESLIAFVTKFGTKISGLAETIAILSMEFSTAFQAARSSGVGALRAIASGFQGVASSVNSAKMAVGLWSAAIAALAIAINTANRAKEEELLQAQNAYDAAMANVAESESIYQLYEAYVDAKRAEDDGIDSKNKLAEAAKNLAAALGAEEEAAKGANGALDDLTKTELKQAVTDAKEALYEAQKKLALPEYSFWENFTTAFTSTQTERIQHAAEMFINQFEKEGVFSDFAGLYVDDYETKAERYIALYERAKQIRDQMLEEGRTQKDDKWALDEYVELSFNEINDLVNYLEPQIKDLDTAQNKLNDTQNRYNNALNGTVAAEHEVADATSEAAAAEERAARAENERNAALRSRDIHHRITEIRQLGNALNDLTNGNVDYNKRPLLRADDLADQIPEMADSIGDLVTMYFATETIGEGEARYTVDITPITEDGRVLSDQEIADYLDKLVTDKGIDELLASDDLHLLLNVVPGELDQEAWEQWYSGISDIKDRHADLVDSLVEDYGLSLDQIRALIMSSEAYYSHFAEVATSTKKTLSDAWDTEEFEKTKEDLTKLSKTVGSITGDKVLELAADSDVLADALQQSGMDAEFLAHVLQTEFANGNDGSGFALITKEALILNDALNSLAGEYAALDVARSKYESGKSTQEKDDNFRSMAEAYKTLNEQFEKGAVNSNAFWNAAEFIFGEAQLEAWGFSDGLDQIYEAMQNNKAVFEDADSAGMGFLTRLKEIADEDGNIIGENGGIIASIKELADGSIDFRVEDFYLDELAEKMGISRDAINACIEALSMFGRVDLSDMDQVVSAIDEIGLSAQVNGQTVVNYAGVYDILRNNLGKTSQQAYETKQDLEAMDGVTLIDVTDSADNLAQSLIDLGVAESNADTITINTDDLIGLSQQINLTKDQAELLAQKIGGIDGLSFTNTEGQAESLDNVLSKIGEADFSKAEAGADGFAEELDISKMTAIDLFNELKSIVGTKWIVGMDRSQLEAAYRTARNLKQTIESTPSAPTGGGAGQLVKQTRARGTQHAVEGTALVGEEAPELWIRDDQATLVGTHGPEIVNLKSGDQILSGSDTKKILGNHKSIHGVIPAFRAGTIGSWRPNGSATSSSAISASSYSGSSRSTGSNSSSSSSKAESAFEKEYKRHQHLLKMEAETQRDYLVWLNDAYQKAYKNNEITLEDFWKYEEEVYQGMKDLFMDYLGDIEHEIDMIAEDKSRVNRIVELYTTAVKAVEKEIEAARKAGLKDTDDYIQQLQKKIKDYQKELTSMREDAQKELEDSEQELVDMRIKMIKQEIDDRKDGLNKQLSDLKDFYQKQKDMLRDARDEEKYLDDQAEKRKKVADIERELSALQRDDSAWAAKRRLELEQNLADARKELREFEKDHAIEVAEEELDKISELREKDINAQIEELENITPHDLYEWASYDIKHATNDLYEAMIEYNNVYGDGIEKNIIDMWDRAKTAFEDYWNTVRALTNDGDSIMMRIASGFFRDAKEYVSSSNLKFVSGTPLKFASGTQYAPAGLHILDEYGSETIFQSKNGQKYKMFTGGEKVLNAKASEFLYKFATSGGEFLSRLVNGAANGLNYLTGGGRRLAVEAVNMGDIIINGNADRSTVSEIRRAQRDALENLLHEFDRLSR